jgi:hypothetical protein
MSCLTTAGFQIQCKEAIGGIKAIYLGAYSTFSNTATINGTSNLVTALTAGDVYEFALPKHTGSFTEEATISIENGTVYYTQTIVASFHGMSAARALELQNIAKGRNVLFVQDNNDNVWMCGYKDGVEVTAFTTTTGTAKGDMVGYTVTFTGEEKDKAYLLDADGGDNAWDNFPTVDVIAGTL